MKADFRVATYPYFGPVLVELGDSSQWRRAMATTKQKHAAKRTVRKAGGKRRAKPGATGEGEYYHIQIRPTERFATFRTHDVGEKGGIQRVAGQREDGTWETQKWLISKDLAHVEQGQLIPDTQDAREVLDDLGSEPEHIEGDRFRAKPEAGTAG
jgi:hypothetical protein